MDDPYRPPTEAGSEHDSSKATSPFGYVLVVLGLTPYALLVLAEQVFLYLEIRLPQSDGFRFTMLGITLASAAFFVVLHVFGCRALTVAKGHRPVLGAILGLFPIVGVITCALLPIKKPLFAVGVSPNDHALSSPPGRSSEASG